MSREGATREPGPVWRKGRYPAVCFRMPTSIREPLEQAAKDGHRTLTAELLLRLEYTLNVDHEAMVAHRRARANEIDAAGQS